MSTELWFAIRNMFMTLGLAIPTFMLYWYLWTAGYVYLFIAFSIIPVGWITNYFLNVRGELSLKHLVVITGCDSGLGYSLALHCHELGATVMAGVFDPTEQVIEDLTSRGIIVETLDITDNGIIKRFGEEVRKVLKERGLVFTTLVNNAGIMIFGECEWQTEKQIQNQIEVNLLGTMKITRELMPIIRADMGRIIVISSHCAYEALPGLSIYSATKAALQAWTTSLRVELGKYGIRVVSFIPGSFTQESNIMAQQQEHFEVMQDTMKQEAKDFYGSYFKRYMTYFSSVASSQTSPKCLSNSSIYKKFNGAILDVYPSAIYRDEPWRYFFYYKLFNIMPTYYRDQLVIQFMRAPSW